MLSLKQLSTETMSRMTTANDRVRLGKLVEQRREQLGISLNRAAQEAGMNRATWTAIERATRETSAHQYGRAEQVLRWAPGSARAILEGGEPTLLDEEETMPEQPPAQDVLLKIALDENLPDYIRNMARTTLNQFHAVRDAAVAEDSRTYGHLRSIGGGAS